MEVHDNFCSFNSDDLEEEQEQIPHIFNEAPWDIIAEADGVGQVLVAQAGDTLPKETKYKTKKGGNVGVKFRIESDLSWSVIKKINVSEKLQATMGNVSSIYTSPTPSTSTPKKNLTGENTRVIDCHISKIFLEDQVMANEANVLVASENDDVTCSSKEIPSSSGTSRGSLSKTRQEWLSNMDKSFVKIIVGDLQASMREQVKKNIQDRKKLTPNQNKAVIASVNHQIHLFIGKQRPDAELCRDVANLLRKYIPDTYEYEDVINSEEFGPLPVRKSKGEGGSSSLAIRIGDNFYNQFVRPELKRPEMFDNKQLLDFSAKKVRKFYGLNPEKWFVAKKITKAEYEVSEANFGKLSEVAEADLEAITKCLESSREIVQIHFRTEDPSSHVQKLRDFWKLPNGPLVLNIWFEWMVDCTDDGNIASTIAVKLDSNMEIVKQILADQRGDDWIKKAEDEERSCLAKYGNNTMFHMFLLRELAKSWRNHAEKVIFIEGEDDLAQASSQPFLHIVKVNHHGLSNNEEDFVISVRVGNTVVFEGVSLCQGLAAIIQITFCFNLLYPPKADDIFNYIQRILARFGPVNGARNNKDHVKKNFVDFQCTLGKIVLQQNKGDILKMIN